MAPDSMRTAIKSARSILRDAVVGGGMRERLSVDHVSLVSSDCTGGCLYHDLGLQFDSPFINMFLPADDFVRVASDLPGYLSERLIEAGDAAGCEKYPIARLGDALIHLVHYPSVHEAQRKWDERVERFDYAGPLFIMNDRNGFIDAHVSLLDGIAGEDGVLFVHKAIDVASGLNVVRVEPHDGESHVPIMTAYRGLLSIRRNYDCFDFVGWINGRRGGSRGCPGSRAH